MHALFPHKTVAQNIEFGLRMKKVPRDERARRVQEVAAMVRLTDLLDKLPSACSGGEAQRVALARTLVTSPTFLSTNRYPASTPSCGANCEPNATGTPGSAYRALRHP